MRSAQVGPCPHGISGDVCWRCTGESVRGNVTDGRVLTAIAAFDGPGMSGGAVWLYVADEIVMERRARSWWWRIMPMGLAQALTCGVNVYPSLLRLEGAGLITSEWAKDDTPPRRRMYAVAK